MSPPGPNTRLLGGELHRRNEDSDDEAIAAMALRQEGIVSRPQLLQILIGRRSIEHRLLRGRLRPQFPGVYAVGHEPLTFRARTVAAVLSVLPEAAGSHWSSAAAMGLCHPSPGPIHVTCPRRRRPRHGIVIHRAPLPGDELVVVDGILVTSVERTILDIAAVAGRRRARRMLKDAELRGLTNPDRMAETLERHRGTPGHQTLVQILPTLDGRPTRSGVEDAFQEFCVRRGIPRPKTNVVLRVGDRTFEVDCLWREARLVVEIDTARTHGTELAFHEDRARDRALSAAGWETMRITDLDLEEDPDELEADLRSRLARLAPRPSQGAA